MAQSEFMSPQQDALEHLRVIRSLMEKAHIYRAISAPAAALGGILSVLCAGFAGWSIVQGQGLAVERGSWFLVEWLLILGVTGTVNVLLLAGEARRRGQPLVSDGMRMALRALVPPLLVGGVLGVGLIVYLHNHVMAVLIWVVCYGLALLATSSFSPKSLIRLGWVFVILGLLSFVAWASSGEIRNLPHDQGLAALLMGVSFGLCHIIYALCVFLSPKQEALVVPR